MHAIVITFCRDLTDEAYATLCEDFAERSDAIGGLMAKAFIGDAERSGGIYFFDDRRSASAYLAGPIISALRAQPVVTDFTVARYEVDETLSARTGLARVIGTVR